MASKSEVMEYDPIMCMMVPKKANDEYFKKGEVYKNQSGSTVKIDWYDKNGDVQYTHNKQSQSATEKGLKHMLERNGYKKVSDAERFSDKSVNELRDIAVSLGADKSKLYGTSKQALIIIIDKLKRNSKANDMKFKISYGKGKPGIKEEIIEASNYREAKSIAAKNAYGWGFGITEVKDKANDALRMPRNLFDREANVISGKENEFLTKVRAECAKISNLKDLDDFVDELANYGYPYSLEKDIDNAIKLQKSRIQKNGTKDSASMVYDEVMAMMKPVTTKDKRTTDYPNWSSAMNHMRDIERKLDTARSNALKELGTAKREIDNLLGSSDITADVEKMLVSEFDRLYKKING